MLDNTLEINRNVPIDNDLDYIVIEDDSSTIEYTRRIYNDSGIKLSVVEQCGLKYECFNSPIHSKNIIKVTEQWSFPVTCETKLRALISSKEYTKNHPTLISMQQHFEDNELRKSGNRLILAVTHEIDTDFFISGKNLFHQPTNLLLSKLEVDKAPEHPQSYLGEDRFLAELDRLNNRSNVIGWQLELIIDLTTTEFNKGVYVVTDGMEIFHVKPAVSLTDKPGIYFTKDTGSGPATISFSLDELKSKIGGDKQIHGLGFIYNKSIEAENHILEVEQTYNNSEKDKSLRKAELENKEWEARNLKLEQTIALEIERRESEATKHESDLEKLTMDRRNNREQSDQRKTDTTIKTVLTWATAMIGGVTLLNKIF